MPDFDLGLVDLNKLSAAHIDAIEAAINALKNVQFSTTERDALSGANLYRGRTIFNTTTGGIDVYYGATTGWKPPWNTAWGMQAQASATAQQTGIGTTEVDVTNMSVTLTPVANRRFKITANLTCPISYTNTNQEWYFKLHKDGAQIGESRGASGASLVPNAPGVMVISYDTPTAASHTYKARAQIGAGTFGLHASATTPNYITVEDIGPNGNAPAA